MNKMFSTAENKKVETANGTSMMAKEIPNFYSEAMPKPNYTCRLCNTITTNINCGPHSSTIPLADYAVLYKCRCSNAYATREPAS